MYEQDLDKIGQEMDKTHVTERPEDSRPIAIPESDPVIRESKERKIVDFVTDKFNDWESARRPRESMWRDIYQMFFSIPEKFKTPSRSTITMAIVFQVIESALPKIINTLFASGEEFFDVLAFDKADSEMLDQAFKIKRVLSTQLAKARFFEKFIDFVKQLLLYGTSFLQVYWKVKREWVWERVPIRTPRTLMGIPLGETVEWQETKEYKVIERRPEVEVLDILDVFLDPSATEISDGCGVIVRSWINKEDLQEMGQGRYPVYENVNHPAIQSSKNTLEQSRAERLSSRGLSIGTERSNKLVEILTFWGKYDVDGDGIREEAQIVIANKTVLLKAQGNPFHHQKRPIIKSTLFPVPKEAYGIGLVEPIMGQVHELNTLKRQRLDNINMVLNRMWQVNTFADVDLDTVMSAPGNIVLTDAMDAVKPLDTPDVTANAYNEAAAIQNDIERATVPPSAQGTPTGGSLGRTARGAQLIIGQALEKFGTATKLIEETALREVLKMFHQLNLQFVDDDELLRNPLLYGEISDLGISPEDLRTDVKFKMIGISEMIGSEAKINQLTSYLGIGAKLLAPESVEDILKKIYELMGFNKNSITIAGLAQPLAPEPGLTDAIIGQASTQGTQAGPPAIPGV